MKRFNSILGVFLIVAGLSSCSKDADYAIDKTGIQPCLKWQVQYPDFHRDLNAVATSNGLSIDANLLGNDNTGAEVQYIIQPVDENGKVAQFVGDFTAELQYSDFYSSPGGGTFEIVIGGYTGTPFTYNGIYAGSIGTNSDSNEGLGVYTNTQGNAIINTYNNSVKFIQSKQTNGSFLIQRKGAQLVITVKSDYNELSDTQTVYDEKLDMYLQLGTNADEDVTTSITLNKFNVIGGGGAIRSDFFDCYSIKLN